jgi:transposase
MTEEYNLIHERVDDIPLLIGLAQQLGLPEIMDRHMGNHGHHQGLSNGWLATVWLAYILSEGDHRKYSVEDWAEKHKHTLEQLVGQPIRQVEFNDDRLGIVLRRLSPPDTWEAVETDLWSSTVAVYEIQMSGVRLDSTTTYGYHTTTEDGVMQYGYSKDHRPDLPQLKLMAAAAEPSGHLLASDVLAGDKADDPLYLPMMARVRRMVGKSGLLYVGDSKMSALETRADIVVHKDYYLTPLPLKGKAKEHMEAWVNAVVDGHQCAQLIWDQERLLGGGYEFERNLSTEAEATGERIEWVERVQVIRSLSLAKRESEKLEQRLRKAEAELLSLTPEPGRGKRQHRDEAGFQAAVTAVLEHHKVTGLLHVTWTREEQRITRYVGRGRGGPNRPTKTEVQVRYVITGVQRNHLAIQNHKHRLGWRVYGTNLPVERMSLAQSVIHYRGGWSLERDFHLVKDRPLGIRPLYVRRDDQIAGLTHLLTLALRLLTLVETQVRRNLAQTGEQMSGLYEGQPSRKTTRPTGVRLLKAFARGEVTLTRIQMGERYSWHITPLSSLQKQILAYLKLSPSLYKRLIENSS